jgi:hypothetical protein
MTKPLRFGTRLLLTLISMTVVVWGLRGLGLLTFMPGLVIWLLLLMVFAVAIVNSLQATR